MSEAKRFYWLKLKRDFFTKNIYVKKLKRMDHGRELVYLYLNLLTFATEDDGIIYFEGIEETLAEELSLILDEDLDLMNTLIDFLMKYELLVPQGDDSFLLTEVLESTGSETRQAEYNRKRREKEKNVNIVTDECNTVTDGGNNVTHEGNKVTNEVTEGKICFLEKREKREEKRDKRESKERDVDPAETVPDKNPESFDPFSEVLSLYHNKCPSLIPVEELTPKRKKAIKLLQPKYTMEQIAKVFEFAEADPFLRGDKVGKGYEGWQADFDYLTDPDHFSKILAKSSKARGQPFDASKTDYAAIEKELAENL